jgi:hypothetical protein
MVRLAESDGEPPVGIIMVVEEEDGVGVVQSG